jgi:hypothetical protein
MARKRLKPTRASRQFRGLKVFIALMAGITLAVLISQYNALLEQAKRLADRAKADRGLADEPEIAKGPTLEPPAASSEPIETAVFAESGQWIPTDGAHDCPAEFPIKGNSNSHIYHLPGGASYNATIPNICFASEEAAEAAGFRATKR